jgi:hypothetical protein
MVVAAALRVNDWMLFLLHQVIVEAAAASLCARW